MSRKTCRVRIFSLAETAFPSNLEKASNGFLSVGEVLFKSFARREAKPDFGLEMIGTNYQKM